MKNWGLDQIGFTVVPTLIFDMTKAKALYHIRYSASHAKMSACFWDNPSFEQTWFFGKPLHPTLLATWFVYGP